MNPVVNCFSGNISDTKARNGSILIFMEASRIHNNPAAIQSAVQFGMSTKLMDANIAPTKKYGFLLPKNSRYYQKDNLQ